VGAALVFNAKYVIQALPTPFSKKIAYSPPLSDTRRQLMAHSYMGIYTKIHVVCPSRFWKDKAITSDNYLFAGMSPNGPLVIFADGSYHTKASGDDAMLVAFMIPPSANEWNKKTDAERKRASMDELHYMLDKHSINTNPYLQCEYYENRWEKDPWAQGVTVVIEAGNLQKYGSAFTAPQGRIHFAGSDGSPIWHGYMEGALFSGERAAGEVAKLLGLRATDPSREAFLHNEDLLHENLHAIKLMTESHYLALNETVELAELFHNPSESTLRSSAAVHLTERDRAELSGLTIDQLKTTIETFKDATSLFEQLFAESEQRMQSRS